jgi:hypothetical protein
MDTYDFRGPTAQSPLILRPGDDDWGPYVLDCSDGLPSTVTISSATVEAYNFAGGSAALVESGSVSVVDSTSVQLNLQAADDIAAGEYHLRVILTLSNGGTKYLTFGPVTVEGWI